MGAKPGGKTCPPLGSVNRVLDLGLVPGTVVVAEMRSPLGDPVAYRVRGASVALRRDQARQITIADPEHKAPDHTAPDIEAT